MKRLQLVAFLAVLITLTACKTQEDIRREKTVENLNEQVAQTQKSTASASARFTSIEEQLAKLTGQIEESSHHKQQDNKEAALLKERMASLEETSKKQTEYLKALNEKVQEQSSYIEQVIKSLSSMTDGQKESGKKKESKNNNEDKSDEQIAAVPSVKLGLAQYKARELEGAKATFLELLESKKTKKKDKEAAFHYLGQIEFRNKNYEESKVYFSKLFSENPESAFGAAALLGLAKSFIQLKSTEEASQSLDELISRFPKSKEAIEGAKLKTKL